MENNRQHRQIKCPQCGCLTFYAPENSSRPFCSDRCRLIDLGQWADESYRVASETPPSEEDIEAALKSLAAASSDVKKH